MALISCPECTQKVSNQANICPHCGFHLDGTLKKFLKVVFRPILFKAIPKDIVKISNLNLLLSFKNRKYTYYLPRYFNIVKDDNMKAEFLTFNGDINILRFGVISDKCEKELKDKKTKEEKLFYVLDTIYKYEYEGKEPEKIVNRSIFNNDCWEGAIMETIGKDNIRVAVVVFAMRTSIIGLTTVVPPTAPEDLYYENIELLKSSRLTEELKKTYNLCEAI